MIELLTVIAILMIIIIISVANFNSSNKISELRNATDQLADEIRNLQSLSFANIKKIENPVGYEVYPYELGYNYKFSLVNNQYIENSEILSSTEDISGQTTFYPLDNINLNNKHSVIKIETIDSGGVVTDHNSFNLAYLFPEAEILFYETNITSLNTDNDLKIYIKHDEVNNWQGVVSVNRFSGRVMSEVIAYP